MFRPPLVRRSPTSRRKTLLAGTGRAGQRAPDVELAAQLALARQTEVWTARLARDIQTLVQWLRHDVLALVGPDLATRRELFDFIVAELMAREPEDARRIRPVRVALQNQRDDLLAFWRARRRASCHCAHPHRLRASRARGLHAASPAHHLTRVLAEMERAAGADGRQVPRPVRCRAPGHG